MVPQPRLFWRNILFALFLAGLLAYGVALAWYTLANFDLVNMYRDANNDDAFYYFNIARNLAEGKFSTFDGGITRTNGYHPVWMLLITPFHMIFDPEAALFGIKTFEIILVSGGVILIALAARLARLPWILLFGVLPALYGQRGLMVGMEAAAALFFLGMLFLTAILFERNPDRWTWPLTFISFALPWVRLEYVAISLTVTGLLFLVEIGRNRGRAASKTARLTPRRLCTTRCRAFVPLMAGSCAGIAVYFAWNGLVFGSIVPVSGLVKQHLAQEAWASEFWGGYDFRQALRLAAHIPPLVGIREMVLALETGAYVLLAWLLDRRSRSSDNRLLLVFLICVFALGTGHVAKIAHLVFTIHPEGFSAYQNWYFVPAYLMNALIVPVRCWMIYFAIKRFFTAPESLVRRASGTCILSGGAAAVFVSTNFIEPWRFIDRHRDSLSTDWAVSSFAGVGVMNRLLPEGSVIGVWDAGIVGYWSRFPVVQLQGLVNSYDYLRRDFDKSLYDEWNLTWFANEVWVEEESIYSGVPFDAEVFTGFYFEGDITRAFRIWPKDPRHPALKNDAARAAWFWRRMDPHLDWRFDNVGILVDGRLVQVFVEDCAQKEEPPAHLVFSNQNERQLFILDADDYVNRPGLCAHAFLLRKDMVPPLKAAYHRSGG